MPSSSGCWCGSKSRRYHRHDATLFIEHVLRANETRSDQPCKCLDLCTLNVCRQHECGLLFVDDLILLLRRWWLLRRRRVAVVVVC